MWDPCKHGGLWLHRSKVMKRALEGLLGGVQTNKCKEPWCVPSSLGFPPLHCHSFLDSQKGSFLPWLSRLPTGFFRHPLAGLSCTLEEGWRASCPGWRETPGGEQQQYWGGASPQMALDLWSSSKGGKYIWGEKPENARTMLAFFLDSCHKQDSKGRI